MEGRQEPLRAGEYALILSDQIHGYETPHQAKVWVGVFSADYFGPFLKELGSRRGKSSVFTPDKDAAALIKELFAQQNRSPYRLRAALQLFAEQYIKHVPLRQAEDDLLLRIRDYVKEHYSEPLTLQSLAADLGYEYHYLSRCFHKRLGINFKEYVNLFRFHKALQLLQERKSVTDIALESGFGSLRTFDLVFSRLAGCTPSEYKKRI